MKNMMNEWKEGRIYAGDGKILLHIYEEVPENLPQRQGEFCAQAVQRFFTTVRDAYGSRLLQDYEKNSDKGKRMHTLPMIAVCRGIRRLQGDYSLLMLCFSFSKGGKLLWQNKIALNYDCIKEKMVDL